MKRSSVGVSFAVLASAMGLSVQPLVAGACPQTIPAVQQWTSGTGTFTFSSTGRIVVNTGDSASLYNDAETFAADLDGLLSRTVTLVTASSPSAGDIFIALGATDTTIGTEGYLMTISNSIQISAKAAAGAFYGTRTVLQIFKQSTTVNQGSIRDYPKGRWRGVMVDVGRKYYTTTWIQNYIQDMAYIKMNILHLHLADGISGSDSGGFRIECDSHPEIVSKQFYSKNDMQKFINLAAKYHITIEPEIDMPGHANWLYATHKNLLLNQQVLGSQYWALDLSKDSSYNFAKDIYNELIPFFPGPYWSMGSDEYMFVSNPNEYSYFPQLTTWAQNKFGSKAIANDCYRNFVNWSDSIIKSKGKIAMAWNDILLGLASPVQGVDTVATDIALDFWSDLSYIGWNGTYPSLAYGRGQMMMNTDWDNFYIIGKSENTAVPTTIYNSWELYTFNGGNLTAGDKQILGGKFSIWGDVPGAQTESQVLSSTFQPERAMAQKLWGAPKLDSASTFQSLATTIGYAPTPVVGVRGQMVFPAHVLLGRSDEVQLFDLRGRLVATLSNSGFAALQRSNKAPFAGTFICRFKGRGIEGTAKINLAR